MAEGGIPDEGRPGRGGSLVMPTALVTGASRGIGRAITEDLLAHGWRVAALVRNPDTMTDLATDHPGRVLTLVADVRDRSAMVHAGSALMSQWQPPDLVVANAGVLAAVGPTWQTDPDQWWREFEVNVRGVYTTLHEVLPDMVARGSGRIVVMSSGLGQHPSPWQAAYGASKAAVTHLVSSLAQELAGTGVAVFAISPGMVATDMTAWPDELLVHRPDLADLPDSAYLPVSRATSAIRDLASGRFDALSGRFIHARADREQMLAGDAQVRTS